mmetsp:Transcript_6997/g.13325  ORF Transcript_6997/g.13325 Transcript_6997/m.13325 type:complete len:299 (+) Transcript_6997:79-975(+)
MHHTGSRKRAAPTRRKATMCKTMLVAMTIGTCTSPMCIHTKYANIWPITSTLDPVLLSRQEKSLEIAGCGLQRIAGYIEPQATAKVRVDYCVDANIGQISSADGIEVFLHARVFLSRHEQMLASWCAEQPRWLDHRVVDPGTHERCLGVEFVQEDVAGGHRIVRVLRLRGPDARHENHLAHTVIHSLANLVDASLVVDVHRVASVWKRPRSVGQLHGGGGGQDDDVVHIREGRVEAAAVGNVPHIDPFRFVAFLAFQSLVSLSCIANKPADIVAEVFELQIREGASAAGGPSYQNFGG